MVLLSCTMSSVSSSSSDGGGSDGMNLVSPGAGAHREEEDGDE